MLSPILSHRSLTQHKAQLGRCVMWCCCQCVCVVTVSPEPVLARSVGELYKRQPGGVAVADELVE